MLKRNYLYKSPIKKEKRNYIYKEWPAATYFLTHDGWACLRILSLTHMMSFFRVNTLYFGAPTQSGSYLAPRSPFWGRDA